MLIDRIFNGNDAVYGLTAQAVEGAIAQHGADKAVEFPHTAYCLPCYYAVTGVKIKTLGDMKEALGVIKSLMTREHQLDDALMSGVATAVHRSTEVPGWSGAIQRTVLWTPSGFHYP